MAEVKFDIYFSGELLPNQDPDEVRARVGALFRVSGSALDRLFSGEPRRIKQQVDPETARRYQKAIQKAGAFAELRVVQEPADGDDAPAGEQGPATGPVSAQPAGQTAAEQPANGEEDTWALAPVGATVDETPVPPPLEVDTSALSATPPNSGSLEEFVVEKTPVPIPDISALKLKDD